LRVLLSLEKNYQTRATLGNGLGVTLGFMTDTAAGLGRRERKKRETRAALHRSAMALFAEKGFRETRVSEIADAADVAEATFFRHFASKEEVALVDLLARVDSLLAALEARPDDTRARWRPARRWSTRPRGWCWCPALRRSSWWG